MPDGHLRHRYVSARALSSWPPFDMNSSVFGIFFFIHTRNGAPYPFITRYVKKPDCSSTSHINKDDIMNDDLVKKTKETGKLYFKDVNGEKPYELWRSFDSALGRDLSLFITGKLYAREKIPHTTRQLTTVAVLTVLSRTDELRLHIQAALNVGCTPEDIAEVIFQTFTYGGIATVNSALKVLREVLLEKGHWPLGAAAE